LFSWGNNANGQLGLGDITVTRSSPTQVGALTNWALPASGTTSSMCVKTDGTLWTWGSGGYGVLGLEDTVNRSSPTQVGALTNWKTPSAGVQFALCVKTDGTLWSWGSNGSGRLGLGDTINRSSPVQVGALTSWSIPTAAAYFAACSKTDGTIWFWGNNYYGQLGQNSGPNLPFGSARSSPVQVGALTSWIALNTARSVSGAITR
jgi:alpha-tubulin suppressor-like RCC1 family protein